MVEPAQVQKIKFSKLAIWSFIISFFPIFSTIIYSALNKVPAFFYLMRIFGMIIAMFYFVPLLLVIVALIGITTAINSLADIKTYGLKGKGLAIASIVLSVILLIASLIIFNRPLPASM